MSRKKFKGALLAVSLLTFCGFATVSLTSCGDTYTGATVEGVTSVSIANKDELIADGWHAGTEGKMLDLTFAGGEVNQREAMQSGALEITSSDDKVASVSGLYILPVGEGKATISVTIHSSEGHFTDTVEVNILFALTEPKPTKITVKDLLALDFEEWENSVIQPVYEVTGIVGDWYRPPVTKYGNFYLQDKKKKKTQIIIYGSTIKEDALTFNAGKWSFNNPQDFLGENDETPVKKGDTVTMKVMLDNYNGVNQAMGVFTNIQKAPVIPYTDITLSIANSTLKIGEATKLSHTFAPENANTGEISYSIASQTPAKTTATQAEGDEEEAKPVIDLVDDRVYGLNPGTATLVAKGGDFTSKPITVTVTEEMVTYGNIQTIYDEFANHKGKQVYFSANYLGSYKGEQNYGSYVNYGDYAILLYKFDMPSAVKTSNDVYVTGEVDIHNGLVQIADAHIINPGKSLNVPGASKLDLEKLDGIDGTYASREATVTGKISDYATDDYDNVTFNVTTASNAKVSVKADTRYTNANELLKLNSLKDGDEVSLKGNITFNVEDLETVPTDATGLQLVNLTVTSDVDVKIEATSIADTYKAGAGKLTAVYGKYMGSFAGTKNNGYYIGDGEYALYIYGGTAPEGTKVGDDLVVTGETDTYNGLFQIAKGSKVVKDTQERAKDPVVLDITGDLTEINGQDASREATISGTITEYKFGAKDEDHDYETVTLKVRNAANASVEVRIDSRYSSAETFAAFKALQKDGTVKVKGNISFFNKDAGDGVINKDSKGLQIVNPTLVTE